MSNPTASFDLNFRHPIQAETTVGFLPGMPKNSPLDTLPVAELLRGIASAGVRGFAI